MITEVKEKRVMSEREVDSEYDGKWVVVDWRPYSTTSGKGCVIAYGEEEDWEALHDIVTDRYDGKALLKFAYVPKEHVIYGMYDIGVAAGK